MADTHDTAAESINKIEEKGKSDAIFMMECLKHLQTPAAIDVQAVATALGYKNSASVGNRIRALKKKFDLNVSCTNSSGSSVASPSAGSGPNTPRKAKGAKANRGPIKAKPEPTSSDEAKGKGGMAVKGRRRVKGGDAAAAVVVKKEPGVKKGEEGEDDDAVMVGGVGDEA
ncbi:hypothetical protein AJ80_04716 [Polytolypa hystricis UAMH7299]|uniref:Myb-like DNA-binding domain-containing protein n=1 Tax=Polytolypa hystricis (strain UAMH7299) TaxID=1447883 RepID=A0A2B7Y9W1_POLH7|nr:hypothetical protein AJ80_04716 [Polytolypa hystricis UAMH7299]